MSAGKPGYSPLPQSNSDSDGSEEEELHISHENKFSSRPVGVQISKSAKTVNKIKKNVINYKPLDDERNVEETVTKFQSCPEDVFIQKSNNSERFSTCRKICFVFSLLLCVFTTVAFMWILPCNIGSCPVVEDIKSFVASDAKNDNYTWKKVIPNLEIIGPCSLVSDSFRRNQNLVFLARNYLNSGQMSGENFLIGLKGKDGSLSWKVKFEKELTIVDCRLIDVDFDGLNDCLLYEKNYITTINSLTGKEMWQTLNLKKGVIFLNFPVLLPDVNSDKVKDLLVSYSLINNTQKYIAIVSGKTGKALSEPHQIKFCDSFYNPVPNGTILLFTCHNSTKEFIFNLNLMDIFQTSVSRQKVNFTDWEKMQQHEKHSDTIFLKDYEVVLENQGHCPESCSVLVNIINKASGNESIYSLNYRNTFGMTPVKFQFKHTRGFILKFWKWNEETEKIYFHKNVTYSKLSKLETSPRKTKILNPVINLDQEMLLEDKQTLKRYKRTDDEYHSQKNKTNLRLITETLIKITLNNAQVNLSTINRDEIIQICQKPYSCHPDVYKQKHLTLVACFNGNETEKLLTFSANNVINSKKNDSWEMQSKIEMLNFK